MTKQFEADLTPPEPGLPRSAAGWPRVRFNFDNGWSASLVLRTGQQRMDAMQASLAACPTGQWGVNDMTELGESEATADEAIAFLAAVAARPKPVGV